MKTLPKPRATLGLLATAVLAVTAASAFLLSAPHVDGEQGAVSLIEALERYHRRHGAYPTRLDALVQRRFLRTIPRARGSFSVSREGYDYEVDPRADLYCLSYAQNSHGSIIGPSSWKTYTYDSFTRSWESGWVPPCLVAPKATGKRFKATRTSKDLDAFVSSTVERLEFSQRLLLSEVLEICPATPCEVLGRPAVCYQADDGRGSRFGFQFEKRESAGAIIEVIVAIFAFERSAAGGRWREVFRAE